MQLRIYSDNAGSPCKGCETRFVGCHSKCVKYIDWQQKHLQQKAKAKKAAALNSNLDGLERESKRKAARKRDGK